MDPKRYTVRRDGIFTTILAQGAIMAAVSVYPGLRPVSWGYLPLRSWEKQQSDHVMVNDVVEVTRAY